MAQVSTLSVLHHDTHHDSTSFSVLEVPCAGCEHLHHAPCCKSSSSSTSSSTASISTRRSSSDVLKETPVNVVRNAPSSGALTSPGKESINSLATDFEKLQLVSPAREQPGCEAVAQKASPTRRLRLRPAIGNETFEPPQAGAAGSSPPREPVPARTEHLLEPIVEETPDDPKDVLKDHPLMQLPPTLPSLEEQVTRHQAATSLPLEHEDMIPEEPKVLVDQMSPTALDAPPQPAYLPQTPQRPVDEARPSLTPRDGSTLSVSSMKSVSSPAQRTTQIEDSVEALDKLEEELEAINAVAHFGRVVSPEMVPGSGTPSAQRAQLKPGVKRTTSTTRRPPPKVQPATVRVKPTEPRPALGKARAASVGPDDRNPREAGSGAGPSKESPARKPVARPASLAPPKPLAKSNKPRTLPTFQLPGETVARRLKEQREARLSLQVNPEKAAQALQGSLPQRAKSTRQPTRPTFELPGEAISRRKREEREAKLKAEQEEERKRREFKARPIRTSIAPSTMPRETIASRARQGKAVHDENTAKPVNGAGTTGSSSKRLSVAGSTHASPQSRGRDTTITSAQVSRATSTSTGSVSGKRSTLSAEDAHYQKLRGREIYERDNNRYTEDKEKERREREANAKLAREQAAERSRQASREWAEKQRRKAQAQGQALTQARADASAPTRT